MKKITAIIISSSMALQLAPLAVFASFHEAIRDRREAVKQEVQQKRDELKQEVREKRDVLKKEVKEKSEALRGEIKEKNQALREELKKRQEALRMELKDKREALKTELKDKREKFKAEEQARKEELKKKLGEKRGENIERFFNQMVGKFEAAIGRLKDLSDRIASRLNKAEENGRNVVELRAKLAGANDKIAAAERALEDAKAKYAEAVKDKDFKASFRKVREVVAVVHDAVREAHRALVDVVNSIKGLGGGESKATTTPTQQ